MRSLFKDDGKIIVLRRWLPVCMQDCLRRTGELGYETMMRNR